MSNPVLDLPALLLEKQYERTRHQTMASEHMQLAMDADRQVRELEAKLAATVTKGLPLAGDGLDGQSPGITCHQCLGMNMRRTGTCWTCQECFESTGCG